jgi:hypothetical protein
MSFDSEDAFKAWLKINGYDKAEIENISVNWSSVSIIDGQITGAITQPEVVTETVEEVPNS